MKKHELLKTITILLLAGLMLMLAACGSSEPSSGASPAPAGGSASNPSSDTPADPAAAAVDLNFAIGATGGSNYPIGVAITQILNDAKIPGLGTVTTQPGGGAANIEGVHNNLVQMGIVFSSMVYDGMQGNPPFKEVSSKAVPLFSLHPYKLTLLVPDLLEAKVRSLAIQRQPDTRLHFVLEDGTVAILLYEPTEEVICWFKWETDGFVERAAVLPGVSEDAVFYVVRREINGQTKRFIEKWALEAECVGDTGLTWLMDAAVSYTDTGRTNVITGLDHLVGEEVIVWSSDTGSIPGVDRSPDINGTQRTYTVDTGGSITLDVPVHHAVVGLPYEATWKSTKLAYGAQAGTALNQMKRVTQMGMVLHQTHSRALQYGADTGALDHMPRVYRGKELDPDHIFKSYDEVAISFPSGWDPDTRVIIKAKAPRPATIMALVPTVQTNERV